MTHKLSENDHNDLLEIIGEIKDNLKPHDHYMIKILNRAEYILGVRTEEEKEAARIQFIIDFKIDCAREERI